MEGKVAVDVDLGQQERLSAADLEDMLEAAKMQILRGGVPPSVWKHVQSERTKRLSVVRMRRKGDVA